jgi:TolB-like protein/DNA-binding winged helix-turn-helix (wHTH) protein
MLRAVMSDLRQGFQIGGWKIEPLRGAITSPQGDERHLEPKVMDVFVRLAEQANEVVTREQLLNAVWTDHVAADELLTGAISDLRQALRADGQEDGRIETVPKVGYRLVGDVARPDESAPRTRRPRLMPTLLVAVGAVGALAFVILSAPGGPFSTPAFPPISAIAVLPFANLSGDPEQDYISEGISRALAAQIGKIDNLDMRSYQSVRQYKESDLSTGDIAGELRVDAVLEGSALLVGERVQIIVTLIDARTDEHLWAESFDGDARDVLKIHNEIAVEVATAIDLELSAEKQALFADAPAIDPEAYRLFLKGGELMDKLTEASFKEAIVAFRKSIELEPGYAPSHAGLADAYLYRATWHGSADHEEMLPLAEAAADEALRLDADLPDTWFVLAKIRRFDWDWLGAERAYRAGLENDPDHVSGRIEYANFLVTMGRFDAAVATARALLDIDPDFPLALNELALALLFAGETDDAIELAERSLVIDPDFFQSHYILAETYTWLGQHDKAIEHLRAVSLGHPDPPPNAIGISGRLYALAGHEEEARSHLQNLLQRRHDDDTTSAAAIAEVYLGLGELDETYKWLQVAFDERDYSLIWLNVDWYYLEARNKDPRFEELRNRMDIPDF